MTIYSDTALSLTFAALADPTRRAILAKLARGEADVSELAKPFGLSQPTISKHLKVLEGAGLVERRVQGRTTVCRLRAEPLAGVRDWVAFYERFWDTRLDRLERLLTEGDA
jgi:DNA-binding transcriptional ArsR family regulator